jgi:cation transport ATPase
MKQIVLFSFLITTGLFATGQSKVSTIKIKASIYCDHCRRCESCGDRLQNAAFTEKGVKRVDIDEKTKTLSIVYNPQKTSPEKIREAIAKVGFDADDVKADLQAYEKLDPCCKK